MKWISKLEEIMDSPDDLVKKEDAKLVIHNLLKLYNSENYKNVELTKRNESLFETLQYSSELIDKKDKKDLT